MKLPAAKDVHFDIDQYLNRIVPHNRISRLPKPVSRFLGYRDEPAAPIGNIIQATWALVGAFCGLTVVTAVYKFGPGIAKYNPPVIVASLGAAAVLNYNVITTPLAQPRNAILGNTLSALTGVCIAKLFMLDPDYHQHRWLAGPLCCGCASWVMTLTNTVYPPGGATAILAATDATVGALGWVYVPVVLLGSVLMLGVALLVNNVQRQYPAYWWTAQDVGKDARKEGGDVEKVSRGNEKDVREELGVEEVGSLERKVVITEDRIYVPEGFNFGIVDAQFVELLRARLRNSSEGGAGAGYDTPAPPSESGSNGTYLGSRDMLPSLKSQKSHEEP
ncbi:Hpp family protein [Lasiodiplodia theobromae]|uniref:Hpp family protein n=1 Tax=Lasiodiplodia theobromae TaxID=45133 RepID=UPI0015C37101|nr:Hpp family protein [Lasiodiplodia theobromae]KAF4543525.1 Hpp family protein [Lasiodiplodia theobromae]